MNRMQEDLRDLGQRLWPDDTPLRSHESTAQRVPRKVRSGFIAAAIGGGTFVVLFSAIALSLVLAQQRNVRVHTPASGSASAKPAPGVTRVDVAAPGAPLTFEVARGTILALHLRLRGGKPESAWGVGKVSGPGLDFAAVQVPYPGGQPDASASDFHVAFRIPQIGMTEIAIFPPATCPLGVPCIATSLLISVHAVTPPILTATITGQLDRACGPICLEPASDATISFINAMGQTITGTRTFDAYFVELPPGTWRMSTTPSARPGQATMFTVVAGQIVVDDVQVNSP